MNTREIFNNFVNFNKNVRTLKCEFGFWGSTIKRWYDEGLPIKNYPKIPDHILTTSASLYSTAWNYKWKEDSKSNIGEIPDGIGIIGSFLFWPNQCFPLDTDVRDYFGLDVTSELIEVEEFFYPHFNIEIEEANKNFIIYTDIDGVKRKYLKKEGTIPTALDWPIKGWDTWLKIKEERLRIDNISKRFPKNWNSIVKEYRNRDHLVVLGGYPLGLFGTLAHLIGYENLFLFYYDYPDLLKNILNTFTDLWIAVWEEVIAVVDVDAVHIWEDVSSGKGSMVSPAIFKEFMLPYYKKLSNFLKSKKIKAIFVDTDGNCMELIPLFIEGGINGIYPMEAVPGMDILDIRKKYPDLLIMGGVPKSELIKGQKRIDEVLDYISQTLKFGGYIPFCDHLIPPEISWSNFKYYREKLNSIIEKSI